LRSFTITRTGSPTRMRLSIVIPALDEAAHIGDTLGPLQDLRPRGHEIILVDGGSRDDTVGLATPLVDRCMMAPRGRAHQMNAGAAAASGDILWFLHADTRAPPDAAQCILNACSHGDGWGRFDVRLSGRQPLLRLVERLMNLRSRMTGIATGDQGMFVTRQLFNRVGGFPDLPLMEDIELSKRLCGSHRPILLRRQVLVSSRRWESRGIVRTIALMWYLRLAYALGVPAERLAVRYDS
jgi:rSAM/selenodomain-associated transferase 2